jgi:hypothetical protein
MTYIYETKHLVNALLDAAVCLAAMTLSIIVIAIAISPSFFHTKILAEDWMWYLLVALAIITLPLPLNALYFYFNRYYDLCLCHRPALIITDSELKVFTPYGGYTTIGWNEIMEFKDGYITRGRQFIYPVYKDDKQNKRRFFRNHIDGILTNFLTMKHDDLLAELKRHLES